VSAGRRAWLEAAEKKYTEPSRLGRSCDFELGIPNGKLSALRRVLRNEWDFLDT
jgi:hypothetical protein